MGGSSRSPLPRRNCDWLRLHPRKSCHLAQSPRLWCLLCNRTVLHLLRGFRVRPSQERHCDDYTKDLLSAPLHLLERPCSCSNGLGRHRFGLNRYHWRAHPRRKKGGRKEERLKGKGGTRSEKARK